MDERGLDRLRAPEPLMERLDRERRDRRRSKPFVVAVLALFFLAALAATVRDLVGSLPHARSTTGGGITVEVEGGSCLTLDLVVTVAVGVTLYAFVAPSDARKALAMFGASPAPLGEMRTTRGALDDMRIAFGLARPPRLFVIDTPAVNALVSGRRLDDAVFAVTRSLADAFGRDEQRAVFAHLFAKQLIGKAAVSEAGGTLDEQADALAMQTLRDPRALLAALERIRDRPTLLRTHRSGVVGALFFAPALPIASDLEDDVLDRRIARLREVTGAEGVGC